MSVTRRALSANEPRSNRGLQTLRNHSSLGTQPWNMRQKILAVNSEFQNLDLTGESIVLTTESILGRPKTKKREDGSRFLVFSGVAMPCFLLGKLHRNPSTIDPAREQIREKTTNYLEQLQFSPRAIRNVQDQIDEVDGSFLARYSCRSRTQIGAITSEIWIPLI